MDTGTVDGRSNSRGSNPSAALIIKPRQDSTAASSIYTARSSCSSNGSVSESAGPSAPSLPPKVGTRFSKESARVLRQWLDTHQSHPFPSREDNEMLQRFTGLSKVQIKTWFANARRRRRLPETLSSSAPRSKSPDGDAPFPRRPGTPIPTSHGGKATQYMDPLERWVDSPPEDEPALARDIARAVASGNQASLRRIPNAGDSDDSSFTDSSAPHVIDSPSFGSRSGSSHGSATSHKKKPTRAPRRPRRGRHGRDTVKTSLFLPDGRFQCTFCTETFRTKHDWSRHEKSLHVPIERWLCSPRGPVEVNPSTGESCCVFCGQHEPTSEHLATHNPDTCKQKIFNRKDHLRQHLRLVHDVAGVAWVMEAWKAPSLKIRSRCGFCGIPLETWPDREDHLADHFKLGHTMANWAGDWGFEEHIMNTVESYMPPYVIAYDRKSPFPFMASGQAPSSPRSAYELLSLELAFFLHRHFDQRKDIPSNRELLLHACRVIFASEALTASAESNGEEATSWLRDLITFDDEVARQARFGPLLSQAESRLAILRINGKNALFEACPLEKQLTVYVEQAWEAQQMVPGDSDLQAEAYRIIAAAEEQLETKTPDSVTNWFTKMVTTSTGWLGSFKRRRNMCMAALGHAQPLPSSATQQAAPPMDMNWNSLQGHNDSTFSFHHFLDHLYTAEPTLGTENHPGSMQTPDLGAATSLSPNASNANHDSTHDLESPTWGLQGPRLDFGFYVLNDANYHRWFDIELKKWATATMSSENPAGHTPSDGEIQHQARLLLYDDGDPWNMTAADNPEWLDRFKRDIGILPLETAEEQVRL